MLKIELLEILVFRILDTVFKVIDDMYDAVFKQTV